MKKFHALTFDVSQPLQLDHMTMISCDTLVDTMLDHWNETGNKNLFRVIYKASKDGALKPFRKQYASDIPNASTFYDLDKTDEDAGYIYGKYLTDEDKTRIDAYSRKQTGLYEEWRQMKCKEGVR